MLKTIRFVTNETKLRQMAYGDSVYAWLLLHSHYNECEKHNYIYEKDFTIQEIARDIHKNRHTVSKRLKDLLQSNPNSAGKDLIYYDYINKCYILPNFTDFQRLDSDTVLNLFWICGHDIKVKEELIKLYAWLKKSVEQGNKQISFRDIIVAFGHSTGNKQLYDNYKAQLTVLQGAGLVNFKTGIDEERSRNGLFCKTFYIYKVNDKASQEWIDKKKG